MYGYIDGFDFGEIPVRSLRGLVNFGNLWYNQNCPK